MFWVDHKIIMATMNLSDLNLISHSEVKYADFSLGGKEKFLFQFGI